MVFSYRSRPSALARYARVPGLSSATAARPNRIGPAPKVGECNPTSRPHKKGKMLVLARHCFWLPVLPHRLRFPARALNCQLSTFNSSLTTRCSLFSVLCFQELTNPSAPRPSTNRFLTPSVSATYELHFQQFPCFHKHLRCPLVFPVIDFQPPLHRTPSQCFQHVTNPSTPKPSAIDFQPIYFQRLTNPSFGNSFAFSSIQNARVSNPISLQRKPK